MDHHQILIKDSMLLDGDGTIKDKVYLRIKGKDIVEVSENPLTIEAREEVIDGSGCIVTPGLVNLHTHSPMGLMRGLGEDLKIEDWFNQFIWRFESKLTPEDVKVGAASGIIEMLESGVTCFADHYFSAHMIAQTAEEIGMRAHIAPTIFGLRSDVEEQLAETKELIKRWNNTSSLVTCCVGPHAPYTCPPEVLEKTALLAEELGVRIHIHVAETEEQVIDSKKEYGKTPFEVLADTGILSLPTIIGHGLWIEEKDLSLLSSETYFAACPKTYMKLSMGFGRLWEFSESLKIGIGTDGAASSNHLDPLEQLRLYGFIGKHLQGAEAFSLTDLWKTLMRGHEALGLKSGSIQPGYRADLVIWKVRDPSLWPLHNPLANLIYSGEKRQVRDVIVNGKVLLRDGHLTTIDREDVLDQVLEVVERVKRREEGEPMADY